MPTLLLIRHGENDYLANNRLPGRLPGIHLNLKGREQAEELARTLNQLPVKAIYSSPMERAIETAEPSAESLGLGIQVQPDLVDTDVGDWAGRSWKKLGRSKLWKVIQETPSEFQFPNGESFRQIIERVTRALQQIISSHTDEMVALFFHADPIKLAVTHYLGLPLDNFQRLSAHTGSVTILKINGDAIKLIGMNLIPPFSFPNI
jgi:broad specificity phosphatase PhoE